MSVKVGDRVVVAHMTLPVAGGTAKRRGQKGVVEHIGNCKMWPVVVRFESDGEADIFNDYELEVIASSETSA